VQIRFAVRRDHHLLGRGRASALRLEYSEVAAARDRAHGAGPLTGCAGKGATIATELDTTVDRLVVRASDFDVDDRIGFDLRRHHEGEGAKEDSGDTRHEASPLFGGLSKIAETDFFVFIVIGFRWVRLFDVAIASCFNGTDACRPVEVRKWRS
jgi:hypothetical protein